MASRYGWILTRNHLEYEERSEGVTQKVVLGPRNIGENLETALRRGEGSAFRMYDDDGNLYYSGKIVGDYSGFEPLDDYGEPNAGCTDIKMIDKKSKKWVSL